MATTVKAVLRKDKTRADGTAPLWIRITAQRKSRYLSTGIYLLPKHWNPDKGLIRKSHPIAPALNAALEDQVLQARQQALARPTAQAVKASLTGTRGSLTAFFEDYIRQLDMAGKYWERKKYNQTLNKVRACLGESMDWTEVDREALIRFERYLRQTLGNKPNTVRKDLGRFQRVFKKAVQQSVVLPEHNPFLFYEKPKGQKVHRRKLSLDEVHALEGVTLQEGSWLCLARDAFVFSFYGGGVRFSDVCGLKASSIREGRLQYRMMKTGTLVSVPLPGPALQIAECYRDAEGSEEAYLFPFLNGRDVSDPVQMRRHIGSCNALVNRQLKVLAERAGLEPEGLSFHVARHSYADYARSKSGDLYAVSKTLGHSSLQVTQQYLKSFDQDAVDRLADQLWEEA